MSRHSWQKNWQNFCKSLGLKSYRNIRIFLGNSLVKVILLESLVLAMDPGCMTLPAKLRTGVRPGLSLGDK